MFPCVIFDIDGTISNCDHRTHFVRNGNHDWDSFFAGISEDVEYREVVDLLILLSQEFPIILVTARPEKYRKATMDWLHDKEITPYITRMYMRPNGDFRQDAIVKREILYQMKSDDYEPWLTIDDREQTVKMWRAEGLTCLQCATWEDRMKPIVTGTLVMMVGPSGAGKSTWLSHHGDGAEHDPCSVISSDVLRHRILGNWQDQTQNEAVFAAVHDVARTRLRHGLDTVIDATHLKRKDRLASVACAEGGPVEYIVIDRPMEVKRRDGGWRNELGFDLLAKHDQTFRSQLKDILAGDNLPNVTVKDLRSYND